MFGEGCPDTFINNTKSFIGHCMGAAGALELAGNLPSFDDLVVHPTINVDDLDPACALPGLVLERAGAGPPGRRHPEQLLRNARDKFHVDCEAIRGIGCVLPTHT